MPMSVTFLPGCRTAGARPRRCMVAVFLNRWHGSVVSSLGPAASHHLLRRARFEPARTKIACIHLAARGCLEMGRRWRSRSCDLYAAAELSPCGGGCRGLADLVLIEVCLEAAVCRRSA